MPQFTVFFADVAGFGIEMVQLLDSAHAHGLSLARTQRGG